MPEPFNDAAFVSRLQKLLSLLGSEQPGEADTARRKLLEHLGHHRLSLTDVGARLRQPQRTPLLGFEDMSLERELHLARVGRQEAEGDVQRARQRMAELSQSLQEAAIDASRAIQGQARARLIAAIGWLLAALTGGVAIAEYLQQPTPPYEQHAKANTAPAGRTEIAAGRTTIRQPGAEESDPSLHPGPGEQVGTVLVQDLPVRLTPNEDGGIRAFLNRGMRVVIERQARIGPQSWLLIRSVTGSGWVRGSDVLH